MAVVPAYILMQAAAPVPQILKHFDINVTFGEIARIAVLVEPSAKDTIGMVSTLGAVGVKWNDTETVLIEFSFTEIHQRQHALLAYMNLAVLAVALVPLHGHVHRDSAKHAAVSNRDVIGDGNGLNEIGDVSKPVLQPLLHLGQLAVERFST